MSTEQKSIRVGVIGVGRGSSFMDQAAATGMELVAICDSWAERLREVGDRHGVATYTDYDAFLKHDMDAVVTANFFHQHAPFAIKALRAGKHVMSETSACKTGAEAVALCEAVEETGLIYMFAENYPYTNLTLDMQRQYSEGKIGQALYGEGEYIHPMEMDESLTISPGLKHWRNNLPSTYYCTHALAPLMTITDTMPVSVNALSVAAPPNYTQENVRSSDVASVILCRMDNGAVFRLVQVALPGHSVWYRVHGTRGLMETTRGPGYWGPGQIRVEIDRWQTAEGEEYDMTYTPSFPKWAQLANRAGHGGGDFCTNYLFAEAIRSGKQPYLDVYRGVAMSMVGPLAWRSALENGAPITVPDFRDKAARAALKDDHWSPFVEDEGPGQPPRSINGVKRPSEEAIKHAREVWAKSGYTGE